MLLSDRAHHDNEIKGVKASKLVLSAERKGGLPLGVSQVSSQYAEVKLNVYDRQVLLALKHIVLYHTLLHHILLHRVKA